MSDSVVAADEPRLQALAEREQSALVLEEEALEVEPAAEPAPGARRASRPVELLQAREVVFDGNERLVQLAVLDTEDVDPSMFENLRPLPVRPSQPPLSVPEHLKWPTTLSPSAMTSTTSI